MLDRGANVGILWTCLLFLIAVDKVEKPNDPLLQVNVPRGRWMLTAVMEEAKFRQITVLLGRIGVINRTRIDNKCGTPVGILKIARDDNDLL